MNKLTICLVVATFLAIGDYNLASAREITVNNNDSCADFRSIQEAVTNSSSGDVILVCPGSYNESVETKTENISILSESEDPEDTTVRAFKVGVNNTTVSGFSIQESLILRKYVFPTGYNYQYPVENCTIKNNILKQGIDAKVCHSFTVEKNVILNSGIRISAPDNTVISNLRISDNLIVNGSIEVYRGLNNSVLLNNTILKGSMDLNRCCGYKILENHVSNDPNAGSGGLGIFLSESYFNEIENNTVVNCSEGIRINSGSNMVKNNILTDNGQGIIIGPAEGGNSLFNNTISNSNIGLFVSGSRFIGVPAGGNSYLNNNISNNNIGIIFECDSSGNLVTNNRIELNKQYGIYIKQADYKVPYDVTNCFYNNVFNNTVNFFNDTGNYTGHYYIAKAINNSIGIISFALNTTKASGTNIVCGPYLGGNYWAKPDGTGFSQSCEDSNGDGIGDLPYTISENETDYLPLVSVSRSQNQ